MPMGGRSASGRARLLPSPIGLVTEFEVRLPGLGGAAHSNYSLRTSILGVTLAGSSTSPIGLGGSLALPKNLLRKQAFTNLLHKGQVRIKFIVHLFLFGKSTRFYWRQRAGQ